MKKLLCVALILLCSLSFLLVACDSENGTTDSDIFYLEYSGTKITLGEDAGKTLEKLGTPKSKKEIGDCGGFGAQVKYEYTDITVYTLKTDTGETIDQISFENDLVSTPKGISISSSKDDVIKEYGTPAKQNEEEIRYQKDNFILKFGIADGTVSSIDYISITQQ